MIGDDAYLRMPNPPLPQVHSEARRWMETRRRRRMLYGVWRMDLIDRLQIALGGIRREAWGEPDLSSNVFRASVASLSVLYDREPLVHHDQAAAQGLAGLVQRSGLWSLLQRHQRDTIGLREMLMFVDADPVEGGAELQYRPVYPDMVLVTPDPERPSRPLRVAEARLRKAVNQSYAVWTWDVWDITDPAVPKFWIADGSTGAIGPDLTEKYGIAPGWPQRYRKADGTPVLPYALRHAAITGELWDAWELYELVEGSLNCAVLWTYFGHASRNVAWAQKYAAGVRLAGTGNEGDSAETRRDALVTDPATVVMLELIEDFTGTPIIGQWGSPISPVDIAESVGVYERRVAAYAGISPADVQRVAGDPRSGFAIALNQDAKREAQKRFEPVFRPADEELLALSAVVANRVGGTDYPETGYRIAYVGLPAPPEEQQAERDQADWEVEHDQASPVDIYLRSHPGVSDADAIDAIVQTRLNKLQIEDRVQKLGSAMGITPPGSAPAGAAADTALNGLQVSSLLSVIQAVASRTLPRDSAVALIERAFSVTTPDAEKILGSVGQTFFADATAPPPSPPPPIK